MDKKKGEIVVSLLGAAVPIPVTVKMDNVRVIRRDASEESDDESDEEVNDDFEDEI